MNELERAAHDLVSRPTAAPPPISELEARGRVFARRRQSARVLAAAAAVIVLLAGVLGASAIRHERDGEDLRTGTSTDVSDAPTTFDVTWSGSDQAGADAMAKLVKARLDAYGATDVDVRTTTPRSMAVSARGISFASASLLLRTHGLLSTGAFTRATDPASCRVPSVGPALPSTLPTYPSTTAPADPAAANPTDDHTTTTPPGPGADGAPDGHSVTTPPAAPSGDPSTVITAPGPGANATSTDAANGSANAAGSTSGASSQANATGEAGMVVRSVGWPVAKPADSCFTSGALRALNSVVVPRTVEALPALEAKVEQEGKLSAVRVIVPSAPLATPIIAACGQSNPPQCPGVLLDGVLVREPDVGVPTVEKPPLEGTSDGFAIHGFTDEEAHVFAAIVSSGAYADSIIVTLQETSAGAVTPTTTPTGTAAPGTTAPAEDLVVVYVAKMDIPRGTPGTDAAAKRMIDATKVPRQFAPSGAIVSTDVVQGKVALFAIAEGTVIVNGMFVDENPATTVVTVTLPPPSTTTSPTPPPTTAPPTPPTTGPSGEELVEVWVVVKDVPRGTEGSAAVASGAIVRSTMPAKYKPATAITASGDISGKVALFDLSAGTVIVTGMFVGTL